jgi:hypothetical protein
MLRVFGPLFPPLLKYPISVLPVMPAAAGLLLSKFKPSLFAVVSLPLQTSFEAVR